MHPWMPRRSPHASRAWENDALRFEIEFDSAGTADGPAFGGEIDVFARSALEEPFAGLAPTIFGVGASEHEFLEQRLLTNGQRADGFVIVGGEVDLNAMLLRQTQEDLNLGIGLASIALVRLVMHEIGHTLGLGHPNEHATSTPISIRTTVPSWILWTPSQGSRTSPSSSKVRSCRTSPAACPSRSSPSSAQRSSAGI